MEQPDVAIVGGGIAGSALALVLARSNVDVDVAVLERETRYPDRVRGEFLAPWGVAEARQLGVLDVLLGAGGRFTPRSVGYDENAPLEIAENSAKDLAGLLPSVPGPLCAGHPAMCDALANEARAAGARFVRGVTHIAASAGERPRISFDWQEQRHEWRPCLLVGADGRNSLLRKQLGFVVNADPPHNFIGGMLIEGVDEWPQDTFSIGTEGDLQFLVFPQGNNRLRLYGCWPLAQPQRFGGPERQRKMLDAFGRLSCLRHSESISRSTPIGPLNAFSNEDHWIDDPTLPGVVMIGDAAGHNDPIIGQGLSIALRDVRLVSDVIAGGQRTREAFVPYIIERRERMRRLRVTAQTVATLRAEFGAEAAARRARAFKRTFVEGWPSPLPASLLGPERLPATAFEPASIDRLMAVS